MPEATTPLSCSLRSVSAALNFLLPLDQMPPAADLATHRRWMRYFPKQRLVVAAEYVAEASDPDATAVQILDRALASLSDAARQDCRAAAVGWIDAGGLTAAAALELRAPDARTLVAASWLPRHLWMRPTPDPDQSPQRALEEALALVKGLASQVPSPERQILTGAIELCDACFRYAAGISPGGLE
jgi:hypothetical protein